MRSLSPIALRLSLFPPAPAASHALRVSSSFGLALICAIPASTKPFLSERNDVALSAVERPGTLLRIHVRPRAMLFYAEDPARQAPSWRPGDAVQL